MEDKLNEEIKNKINKIWEEDLKIKINEKINSTIDNLCEEFSKKLEKNEKALSEIIEKSLDALDKEKLKSKLNKCPNILTYENNSNNLIHKILICLSNIESLVIFCLNENDNLKKVKNQNGLFTFLIDLIKNLWTVHLTGYSALTIISNLENTNIYNSNNPGNIISFILTTLSIELNLINPKNNNGKENLNVYDQDEALEIFKQNMENNYNKISKEFFLTYKIKKICKKCNISIKYFYEQRPLADLFIQKEDQEIKHLNVISHKLSLNENFFFLLNNDIFSEENCEICGSKTKFEVWNSIEILNNNILIINLNKEDENREISYEDKLKLEINSNKIEFELISVLINNKEYFSYIDDHQKTQRIKKDNYKLYCKNFIDNKWYNFNNKILKVENEKEIYDEKNALLLIYQKI